MSNKKTNGNEICMLCGAWKEEESLICRNCFKIWLAEWEKDEKVVLIVWTFQKAEICRASIDEELKLQEKRFSEFQRSIKQQAYNKISMALKGVRVSDFSDMLERKQKKLWKERDGDKLYGQLKRSEARTQKLPGFTQELKAKIEQYDKEERKTQEQQQ